MRYTVWSIFASRTILFCGSWNEMGFVDSYTSNVSVGAWVDLTLAPGAKLVGTVTARETRAPVAGATIVVHEWTFRAETTTDAEGRYAFAALPPPGNAWSGFSVVAVAEGGDGFAAAARY